MVIRGLSAGQTYSEQASLGQWATRVIMTLIVLAIIALALYGMRHGWRARARRQSELPALPAGGPSTGRAEVIGTYVGTVRAGDWLDRIVAAGGPARAAISVGPDGVEIRRSGEDSLVIGADRLVEVGTAPGLLQKVYGRHGVLLITWMWGDQMVSSGLWFSDPSDQRLVRVAVEGIAGRTQAAESAPETA
ncbi:MAG: hypothetical protein U0990_12150 [Candidatus Nanopelagicales bacterium]|nr:hypothetical protein [Candidatus Nanopelagicales bacterium]MDZ4250819.1 hypothetical protein [Candidatus Nanopelagicales bacterium]